MEAESEGAFQSDIMMTDEQWASLWAMLGGNVQGNGADAGRRRKKRKAVAFEQRRWPLKTVPYEISSESGKLTIIIYIHFADDNHNLFYYVLLDHARYSNYGRLKDCPKTEVLFSKKFNFGPFTDNLQMDLSYKPLCPRTKESVHFTGPFLPLFFRKL